MKRSQMNTLILEAREFFLSNGVHLPPFADWTPDDWAQKGNEVEEIVDCHLGWDVTDYGLNDFYRYGLMLFTLRNGSPRSWQRGFNKHYAEKVVILELNQTHQMHHHKRKMEDIINRRGGVLAMQVYNAAPDDTLDDTPVRVNLDGVWRTLPAGSVVYMRPGESISITPLLYHRFWAEEKRVLMGEVSDVNDDLSDNTFYQLIGSGRFSEVEEDVPALRLLCNEYERYWKPR